MIRLSSKQIGFTIVELLVAIVVVGVLAAITIVAYNEITGRSAVVVLKSDLDTASALLTSDYVKTGSYAANADSLPKSSGTVYTYNQASTSYCLSATSVKSGNSTFHISSSKGVIEEGVCPWEWKQITANNSFNCAVASNNLGYCWGINTYGYLGNNSTDQSLVPVAVNMTNGVSALYGKTVESITAGEDLACAIASDNLAYCWGDNTYGQLGNNLFAYSLVPVAVNMTNGVSALYGKTVKSIAVGFDYSCAIASDNLVYCWGRNGAGGLGNNSTIDSSAPVAVYSTGALNGLIIKDDSLTNYYGHSCVIASDNLAYCWGFNSAGQLGIGNSDNSLVPIAVNMTNGVSALYGKTIKSIAAGAYHTCAIASDDLAYCWGWNINGQVGDNSSGNVRFYPVAVNMTNGVSALYGKTVKSIAVGYDYSCAIASDNLVYCWGLNTNGQLGNNSVTQSSVPVAVTGLLSGKVINSLALGWYHACAIDSDNLSYCWGLNTNGQLGNNSITQSLVPVAVVPPTL